MQAGSTTSTKKGSKSVLNKTSTAHVTSDFDFQSEDDGGEEEEDIFDSSNPEEVFARMELSYNKIIGEMEENPAVSKYVDAFSALFDYLYTTREKTSTLTKEIADLTTEMDDTDVRLTESHKIIEEDEQLISSLGEEIEKSHMLIDEAHAREQAAQEVIDNLRKTIGNLNAEIDFKNKMGEGEEEDTQKVSKHRQGIEREKAKLMSEVSKLSEKLDNALAYQEELEHRADATDIKIHVITDRLDDTSIQVDVYKRNKEKLEVELEEFFEEIVQKNEEIDAKTELVNKNRKDVLNLDAQAKEQTQNASKCYKELETWNIKYCRLQKDHDILSYHANMLQTENKMCKKSMKLQVMEQNQLLEDLKVLVAQKTKSEKRAIKEHREKHANVKEREVLRKKVLELELAVLEQKRRKDADKRRIENNMRERDIFKRNLGRQLRVAREHMKVIKTQQKTKAKQMAEVEAHIIEERKQHKQITYLQRERERLAEDAIDQNKKMEDIMEVIRTQKSSIFDLQKQLAEAINRLRMQQNLYEAVCTDKSALQKTLIEVHGHMDSLKTRFSVINRMNVKLTNEISAKDLLVLKGEDDIKETIKDKEDMQAELKECIEHISSLRHEIQLQKAKEKSIYHNIKTNDKQIRDQYKLVVMYVNEREVLGAQLVRRNEELCLLYDKCMILQTTLRCGGQQYGQRLNDIKLLKIEIKRLRQENSMLTKSINNMNDLKQELYFLTCDLNTERLKCEMLGQELRKPLNIHHWRKLEGSEPEVYHMLQRITLLQKRILRQSRQLQAKEKLFKEANTLRTTYMQVVSKQLGPMIYERIEKTNKTLAETKKQSESLENEYHLMDVDYQRCKLQLERATNQLLDYKRKLLNEKKLGHQYDQYFEN